MPRSLAATTRACVVCRYASLRNRRSVAMRGAARVGARYDEMALLGMLREPALDVRTRSDDRQPLLAGVGDRRFGERIAHAATAQAWSDLGVNELEGVRGDRQIGRAHV